MSSLWALTKNSFLEITRQPVYGILLVSGMTMVALSPTVSMFTLMNDVKLVIDMGLATILLVGLILAVLSATQVIHREIEAKTAGAVISKPVNRLLFVVGKFLGVSLAVLLACYLVTIVLLLTVRIGVPSDAGYELDWPAVIGEVGPLIVAALLGMYCNYFYHWNFSSTAVLLFIPFYTLSFLALCLVGPQLELDWFAVSFLSVHGDQILRAAVLIFLCVWVISAVAVAASTRLHVVPNVIICTGILFVGLVSRYLFGQYADTSWGAWVAYRVVPYLQAFWSADQLMLPEPYIPWRYVGYAAAYAAAWCAAVVMFGAFLFERRELI